MWGKNDFSIAIENVADTGDTGKTTKKHNLESIKNFLKIYLVEKHSQEEEKMIRAMRNTGKTICKSDIWKWN